MAPKDASAVIDQFATYVRYERGLSARTTEEYSADMNDFVRFLGTSVQAKRLLEATPEDVARYVLVLTRTRKYTTAAVKRRLASIRGFYRFARRKNLIGENAFSDFPGPKMGRSLPKVLTETEVAKLLTAKVHVDDEPLYARDRAILELLYATGIRIGELVGLNIRDVDRERRVLRVTGKGNKTRFVLFNKAALRTLNRYLASRPAAATDALFLSRRGTRITVRAVRYAFEAMKRASGIEGAATPHTLRHSFATHMLEHGADLMVIKELLGHENLATTQIYTNISLAHIRKSYEHAHPRDRSISEE
jgi:integrase/recombinase XerC